MLLITVIIVNVVGVIYFPPITTGSRAISARSTTTLSIIAATTTIVPIVATFTTTTAPITIIWRLMISCIHH